MLLLGTSFFWKDKDRNFQLARALEYRPNSATVAASGGGTRPRFDWSAGLWNELKKSYRAQADEPRGGGTECRAIERLSLSIGLNPGRSTGKAGCWPMAEAWLALAAERRVREGGITVGPIKARPDQAEAN